MAGRNIWLTEAMAFFSAAGGRVLKIDRCRPAAGLPGGGDQRDQALHALQADIARRRDGVPVAYGMDFPFTLPRRLLGDKSWGEFILSFEARFADPEEFRTWCRKLDNGRERKRRTEKQAEVPFAAYNLRLYRQTFYGIRDILGPLVRDEQVWVPPMQKPDLDRPWLLETCPASALKRLDLYAPYKGREKGRRQQRRAILAALLDREDLSLSEESLREVLIENTGGDALDSLIAAAIAFWNAPDPIPKAIDDLGEGHVYR